jgi:hypothetical protein
MSALGHKRTLAVHKPMSALPPIATTKADIGALKVSTANRDDGGYRAAGWKIKPAPEKIRESSGAGAAGDSVFAAWAGSGPRLWRQRQ